MWINIRTFCGTKSERFDGLSKLTKIETLRGKIQDTFDVPPNLQKLFYRGKLLVDQHSLHDYNVAINDTIQLMIVTKFAEIEESNEPHSEPVVNRQDCEGLYGIGEEVDVFDPGSGAWFEGIVKHVFKEITKSGVSTSEQLYYLTMLDGYDEVDNMTCRPNEIRPRAHFIFPVPALIPDLQCMVNYNFDVPCERGFWYDATLSTVTTKHRRTNISAKIMLGSAETDVQLVFVDDIFRIESRNDKDVPETILANIAKRTSAPECTHCKDDPRKACKYCACSTCGKKENPDQILLCDECDYAFHLYCLSPPLVNVPTEDDWYCSVCKNDDSEIVRAGEGLKVSKRKVASNCTRDWGKGMACQGRTKVCTIVPQNHVGPVPGITVGSMWKYRLQVSEVGIHRPHVAGIHGRANDGAYSIVLSGGYEDDIDHGDEFYYTGSGGRDLSGNKRTAEQSCDQQLTKMNLALARCCAAPLNSKDGAQADEWKKGMQIRVIRNCKLGKHSKYAPKEGNRYDGIYKIVKYWPETGRSGFLVWRYLLRRDDEAPEPWTKKGQEMTKKLGLKLIYPEGYLEDKENAGNGKNGKRKRNSNILEENVTKKANNQIDEKLRKMIKCDEDNTKQWSELLTEFTDWHDRVSDTFTCICCTDVVFNPITTPCKHNICLQCIKRSFKAEVLSCPVCRYDLGKTMDMKINKDLQNVLLEIFPGYSVGR